MSFRVLRSIVFSRKQIGRADKRRSPLDPEELATGT